MAGITVECDGMKLGSGSRSLESEPAQTPRLVAELLSLRNQAFAQACAVYSPFLGSMSAIAILHQMTV